MVDPYHIILRPIVTEKTHNLSRNNKRQKKKREEKLNAYTFEVAMRSTKPQIREAIERVFGVRVTKVCTAIIMGKRRQLGRGRYAEGRRKDWKKAVVYLAQESKISLY